MIPGLPQWRCHKVVGAVKITALALDQDGGVLVSDGEVMPLVPAIPMETFRARTSDNSRPLRFPDEYVGGYLVQYEDGYLSWSPAKAFEEGYTRIQGTGGAAGEPMRPEGRGGGGTG